MPEEVVRQFVEAGEARLAVYSFGEAGTPLVCVASLGRGHSDFAALGAVVAEAGVRLVAVDLRGIGESTGSLEGITVHELAADVAAVIEVLGLDSVDVLGHAFGNRVVRCLASDRPELVRTVTLVAAGGRATPTRESMEAFSRFLEDYEAPTRPYEDRLADMKAAHFSPGSDASVWMEEWFVTTSAAHQAANAATPVEEWWEAGDAPLLVIQGLDDQIAPHANGEMLKEALGKRVTLVDVADAGHALLVEKPKEVGAAVVDWLGAR